MTRTKNRVFCIAPEQNPSEFLLEIKRDYKNVILHGEWNEEEPQQYQTKVCPLCGYPMQLKYKKHMDFVCIYVQMNQKYVVL